MTDTSIFPSADTAVDPGGPGLPPEEDFDSEGNGNRRNLMIIGGVVAVIVIVAAAFLLLHKSGGGSSPSTGAVPRGTPPASTAPSTSTSSNSTHAKGSKGSGVTTLPKKSHTKLVRDPFKPLVSAPVNASSSNQVSNTTVSPAPTTTSVSVSPTAPVIIPTQPSQGGAPTTGTGGKTTVGAPVGIQLVRTSGDKWAVFDVFYVNHKFRRFKVLAPKPTSARGTVFDKEFALLGIQDGSVTIQEGDGTPFDLQKGVSHSA